MTFSRAIRRHSLIYLLRVALSRVTGIVTASVRRLPDFLILGGQRCGTTSLYRYLLHHPDIRAAYPKEVHFFTYHYHKGLAWYRSHFPLSLFEVLHRTRRGRSFLTGEATPYYLFHPLVPWRVGQVLPNAKLIILLRNPVLRAYSHYHHEVAMGTENLSFRDAIEAETSRLNGEEQRIRTIQTYTGFNHQHYSYIARGIYIKQLRAWNEFFKREQMLVLASEQLFRDPASTMNDVCRFLEIPSQTLPQFETHNSGKYSPMTESTRVALENYFKSYNEQLYQYLNMDFKWEKDA